MTSLIHTIPKPLPKMVFDPNNPFPPTFDPNQDKLKMPWQEQKDQETKEKIVEVLNTITSIIGKIIVSSWSWLQSDDTEETQSTSDD